MTYGERLLEADKLTKDNQALLSTPLLSEGSISPWQVSQMSKRQRARWNNDKMAKMELDYTIKQLRRTDEEVAIDEERIQAKREAKRQSTIGILKSKIAFIHGLGVMSHKRSGQLKKLFQITVDRYQQEIIKLVA